MSPELEKHILEKLAEDGASSQEAFATLCKELQRPLLNVCFHITGNQDDAKDAVQETLIAIHRQLSTFRRDASLTTWAFQIAIRIAVRIGSLRTRT